MLNDAVTLKDLSVFSANGNDGVIALIDHCTTTAGRDVLYKHVKKPPQHFEELTALQDTIKFFSANPKAWPAVITNGTLVMLQKFFEEADGTSAPPSGLSAVLGETFQRLFNK